MRRRKRVIIVGAGLSGLSAAVRLRGRAVDFLVLEKEREPGGLCRTRERGRFLFDHSGHLLHFRTSAGFEIVDRLLEGRLTRSDRNASVYLKGYDVPYPFQANLYALPEKVRLECVRGLQNRGRLPRNADFASWVNSRFGAGIARHFMLPYNRKFWRYPLNRMTCAWTSPFVPVPSAGKMLAGARRGIKEPLGYNSSFWYPSAGRIDALPRRMAGICGNVLYGRRVSCIDRERRMVRTSGGEEFFYSKLISTMPLPELEDRSPVVEGDVKRAFRSLRWNSLLILSLGLSEKPRSARHWIYFPGKEFVFYRVCLPHNFSFSAAPGGQGSLYAEVSYPPGRRPDIKLLKPRILKDLRSAGILTAGARICEEDVLDIEYAYPVYNLEYAASRKRIVSRLLADDVILCGRYGSWRYFSMEDAVLDGIAGAERAVGNA